ncbi:unnamed protein product [Caenorhabditis brenneri]
MSLTPTDKEFLKQEQCMRLMTASDYEQIAALLFEKRGREIREGGRIGVRRRPVRINDVKGFYAQFSRRPDPYGKALQRKRTTPGTKQEGRRTRSKTAHNKAQVQSISVQSEDFVVIDEVEGTPMEVVTDRHEEQENKEPAETRVTQADQRPVKMFKTLDEIEALNTTSSKDVVKKIVDEIAMMIESAAEKNIFINLLEQLKTKLSTFESNKISSFTEIHKLFNKALATVEQDDFVVELEKAHSEFIYMFKALGLCCGLVKEEVLESVACDEDEKCRIRQNDKYHHYNDASYDFAICAQHFDSLNDRFKTRDNKKVLNKTDFKFKTHDDVEYETMEECGHCGKLWHDSCRTNLLLADSNRLTCSKSHDDSIKKISAERIPITVASDSIEKFVNDKIIEAFPDAEKITMREVATKIATTELNNKMNKFLEKTTKESPILSYRYRHFIAVQKIQGRELLFFSFSVQEYLNGFKNGWTNLEYVDSIKFISNPKLRTTIYQTILLGYFKFAASIGFRKAHIFAMAPQEGDSFFFRGRPDSQKVSNQQHLLNWYHNFLTIGKEDIVDSYKIMDYTTDFEMLNAPEIFKSLYFVGGLFTNHFEEILKKIRVSFFNDKSSQEKMKKKIESIANENADNLFYIELKPADDPIDYVEYETSTTITGEEDEWTDFQETKKLEFSSLERAHHATLMILKKIIVDMDLGESLNLLKKPNEWIGH